MSQNTRKTASERAVDYQALADFRYAIRKFLAFSEGAAAEAGLTTQQHQALLTIKALAGEGGIPVGVLAERLLIKQHTAVELIDRLEQAELVKRVADLRDRRRVLISLTREGEKRLRKLSDIHLDELKAVGPGLVAILADLLAQK